MIKLLTEAVRQAEDKFTVQLFTYEYAARNLTEASEVVAVYQQTLVQLKEPKHQEQLMTAHAEVLCYRVCDFEQLNELMLQICRLSGDALPKWTDFLAKAKSFRDV